MAAPIPKKAKKVAKVEYKGTDGTAGAAKPAEPAVHAEAAEPAKLSSPSSSFVFPSGANEKRQESNATSADSMPKKDGVPESDVKMTQNKESAERPAVALKKDGEAKIKNVVVVMNIDMEEGVPNVDAMRAAVKKIKAIKNVHIEAVEVYDAAFDWYVDVTERLTGDDEK